MRKIILLTLSYFLISCVSVKKYNKSFQTPINQEKLKKDVDYAFKNLNKLHPNLYWYISKNELEYQFDSLKSTINRPLTPSEFFQKLAPVIAKIKEGHLRLVAPEKRLTKKEMKSLKNQKGLFSRMNYVIDNDRIFVKDNTDKFENINVGTEILKIKGISASNYLNKYQKYINSDGFNITYQKYSMARRWPSFFTIENGILDSVDIETKFQDEAKTIWLHRVKIQKKEKKEEKKQLAIIRKDQTKKTKDYNPVTKNFNRDLQFLDEDSAIAYMKIKTFSGTLSKKFYKQSFATIKKAKSDYLIIDIRDNLGGSLAEINNLYSYLALKKFRFIDDIEVTSRTSMYHANYFNEFSPLLYPVAALSYPFYFIGTTLSIKKNNDKFYLKNNNIFSIKNPKKNAFKGKIYVLINGSSFSASSTISSKLKGDQRAFLVGEETGGANDGTVAGRYSTKKLPYSKLYLPIGLMLIQPDIQFTETKKGVIPDQEIMPTLQDILQKKDTQLNWILNDIKVSQYYPSKN